MAETNTVSARSTCRVCGKGGLVPILSLGDQYVSNFVDAPDPELDAKAPLDLVLCDPGAGGCGLLQLMHTVAPEFMYRQYWYKSGANASMREALGDISLRASQLVELEPGDIVLDIGCNDGTLLRSYAQNDLVTVGFDPAANLMGEASVGTSKVINDFFGAARFQEHFPGRKAKAITSIAMFYDLEDPNAFVAEIAQCLDPQGVWVVQMSYLPSMLEQNAFDNICHEHLEYYSLMALEALLARHGFEVFDVELNDVNGGSFRAYIGFSGQPRIDQDGAHRVEALREKERALSLGEQGVYNTFAERVNEHKDRVVRFITEEVAGGKTVYVYGASTKGNTLLQFYGLDHTMIKAAAEVNSDKWGKKTVGTLIPIISEEEARADNPDYFLVLPWHFLKGFKVREEKYLQGGGKFIVPLPEFEVIGADDL